MEDGTYAKTTLAFCCICHATTYHWRLNRRETECRQCGAVHNVKQLPKENDSMHYKWKRGEGSRRAREGDLVTYQKRMKENGKPDWVEPVHATVVQVNDREGTAIIDTGTEKIGVDTSECDYGHVEPEKPPEAPPRSFTVDQIKTAYDADTTADWTVFETALKAIPLCLILALLFLTGSVHASNVREATTTFEDKIDHHLEATYDATTGRGYVFGDGADGTLDFIASGSVTVAGATLSSGTYTMTRDIYAKKLTVEPTVIIKTAGFRIFCYRLVNLGQISGDGNAGSSGSSGTAGGANAAALLGASGAGGAGNQATGTAGGSVTSALGGAGGAGGNGITSGSQVGGAAGAVTVPTAALGGVNGCKAIPSALTGAVVNAATLYTGGAGGGGGGGDNSAVKGGGGGSGGRVVIVNARAVDASSTGSITAAGGAGGVAVANSGGGGGGGGGAIIINTCNPVPATMTTNVAGGAGGALVSGTGATAGAAGAAGIVQTNRIW